jgi:hypothetical protein
MTQQSKSVTVTGVILGWDAAMDNKPGRLFIDSDDGPELVLNIWPEAVPLLTPLGDMANAEGTRIEAIAKYVETRGTEVRYRPSAIKVLEVAPEGASPTEPTRPAPRAPSRSAPAGDTQRDSIERQVAAKGAIELLSTKAIQASEFDQWFDHILDRIQGRQVSNNEAEPQQAEPPASSVQRL